MISPFSPFIPILSQWYAAPLADLMQLLTGTSSATHWKIYSNKLKVLYKIIKKPAINQHYGLYQQQGHCKRQDRDVLCSQTNFVLAYSQKGSAKLLLNTASQPLFKIGDVTGCQHSQQSATWKAACILDEPNPPG